MAKITGLGGIFYKVADLQHTKSSYAETLGFSGEYGITELEATGVEILGRQEEPYGKFARMLDCDGVKIELWEQNAPAPEGS